MPPIVLDIAYNTIYDTFYYALTAVSILLLSYTIFLEHKKRQGLADPTQKNQLVGIALAAGGFAVTIFAGVFFDTITKRGIISDLLYQQLHFPLFYVGSAMILFGIDSSLLIVQKLFHSIAKNPHVKKLRILLWGVFTATVAISVFYLFTVSAGPSQHVAQQPIFFLPIILVILIGIIELPILTVVAKNSSLRNHLAWFSLSMFLIFVGALREATIIPSSGEPLIDLLLAFAPFTAASFCLYMSAKSLKF
jgi:hypothetical protein